MSSAANTCGAIMFVIMTIVGFIGNLITAIVLLRDRTLRQHSTTAFILSLCISDLICSSFTMPMLAADFLNEDLMNNHILCKLCGSAFYMNFAVTTFSIAGIAINRYVLIVHYHLYKRFYRMSIILCHLSIIWFVPVGLMIAPLMDKWGTIGKYKIFCRVLEKDGKSIENVLFVIGIMAPCLIISVLYACIYYKVQQQSKIVSQNIPSGSSAAKERERHLTIMTFLIFISFLVCCLPAVIIHFCTSGDSQWLDMVPLTFCGLLCTINPFIYAATNRKYRAAYCKLFSDLRFWNFADQRASIEVATETTNE